jgi:hypothetical protein
LKNSPVRGRSSRSAVDDDSSARRRRGNNGVDSDEIRGARQAVRLYTVALLSSRSLSLARSLPCSPSFPQCWTTLVLRPRGCRKCACADKMAVVSHPLSAFIGGGFIVKLSANRQTRLSLIDLFNIPFKFPSNAQR